MNSKVIKRFLERHIVDPVSGCWLWSAGKDGGGYGNLWDGTRVRMAHAIGYEIHKGKIPKDHELDHKCRVHGCVNPDHLEPVPHRINVLRGTGLTAEHAKKTHCPSGHPYDGVNVNGSRICKTCQCAASRAYYNRRNQ